MCVQPYNNTQHHAFVIQTDLLCPRTLKVLQHLRQQNTQPHFYNEFGDSNTSSFRISNKTLLNLLFTVQNLNERGKKLLRALPRSTYSFLVFQKGVEAERNREERLQNSVRCIMTITFSMCGYNCRQREFTKFIFWHLTEHNARRACIP